MNADGSSGAANLIEVSANDPREAMAAVVMAQSGWFTVELLEQSAPADVSNDRQRTRTAGKAGSTARP